jgi:alkanesulfonate monooxygenase SsuD/methylene tetrahydromethanopterin reductase-like flavin-dependent oxidoreductase (luciferase family)
MRVDLLFDPFGARWADVRNGAETAERTGFDGVWLYDHLAGSAHGAPHVLECWTTLTAIAASVPRVAIGPLVLNVANRDPGVLAVMAATLQEVSGGRLLLGLGAGGGIDTPYAAEQEALGREVPGDVARRAAVEDAIATLRATWSGTVAGVPGFLRPEPPPPVIIGAFAAKMAEIAGRVGDGINIPAGPGTARLVETARQARSRAGRPSEGFIVTASGQPSRRERDRLAEVGVDRLIIFARPPYRDDIDRTRRALQLE